MSELEEARREAIGLMVLDLLFWGVDLDDPEAVVTHLARSFPHKRSVLSFIGNNYDEIVTASRLIAQEADAEELRK